MWSAVAKPLVFVCGNHSAGKSSFLNYLAGIEVQTVGVAPTDDSFTVIGWGEQDVDRDGYALVGDPDLGFDGLQWYGSGLLDHLCLKIRSGISFKDFLVVDSPGMIDDPRSQAHGGAGGGRGYDFPEVCRYFAERADIVLLFFDPDKPGTTAETLSVLKTALADSDRKLHILFNKADKFHKIHDFAR
jgi:predicted GTPase